ncbi:MAG: Gfo/Idh/MocA family oxidoreductase [Eubacteriales bacterium]|nr:Gfo/Idh/MocA family oxidoreductase [Eubacteriales bacterium]
MEKTKLGILGAGSIARMMATTVSHMSNVEAYAVAARDGARAEAFRQEFGFTKAYGSYEAMLSDPEVDLVYIATPHSHHAQHAMLCIEAGKHVLCEKAFTVTAKQAEDVLRAGEAKGVLVTEAIWPRYMPMANTIREFLQSGKIGKITGLSANLGYPVYSVPRIQDPALAGGALLDVGVYALTFASMFFGDDVNNISSTAVMNDRGVDTCNSVTLTYEDGRIAMLHSNVISVTDRQGIFYGETGFAVVDNINNFERLTIYDSSYKPVDRIERPPQITGYEYEVESAIRAIREGRTECPEMPHEETIRIMALMDEIRHSWGLYYPGEQ